MDEAGLAGYPEYMALIESAEGANRGDREDVTIWGNAVRECEPGEYVVRRDGSVSMMRGVMSRGS